VIFRPDVVDAALRSTVWTRAESRCEYCRLPATLEWLEFQIDHVIAQKHLGPTSADNLALSCFHCNSYKGPNIAGIDAVTGRLVPLFNPRRHKWENHFSWEGPTLVGRTAIARATIHVLWLNHPRMIQVRASLIEEGVFPP
jgi:5-methylcytosine-specific restriction endonuclease McrA